jgi:hypothetical protein
MNKTINFWIFGISILLLGASLFLNISSIVITNESTVLVFVGILATFIVVGNFAQVSEIRNSTDKQIKDLDLKTQNKIDQLNILYDKINKETSKLGELEKKTYYIYGEAYRLFGIYTLDKNDYRNSTAHLLNALSEYNKSNFTPIMLEPILEIILDNLKTEKWNSENQIEKFEYKKYIAIVNKFPETYKQKQDIIDLLEIYESEDKQKKKNKKT